MTITVLTSNQPRHIALIESLACLADTIYAVQECNTVFPGQVPDFFKRSVVMQSYFARVLAAERKIFGPPRFTPASAVLLPIKMGDLNMLEMETFAPALESDLFVVFGASYIKGPLCEFLVSRRAYNIHMGLSPYYRGSSTNFWALYDNRPDYVGATIHLLTEGLDSGPMLFHALPKPEAIDPFELGMKAVKAAHRGLIERFRSGELQSCDPLPQDKSLQLRYTRNSDFTDQVAGDYLARLPSPESVQSALEARQVERLLRPYIV